MECSKVLQCKGIITAGFRIPTCRHSDHYDFTFVKCFSVCVTCRQIIVTIAMTSRTTRRETIKRCSCNLSISMYEGYCEYYNRIKIHGFAFTPASVLKVYRYMQKDKRCKQVYEQTFEYP